MELGRDWTGEIAGSESKANFPRLGLYAREEESISRTITAIYALGVAAAEGVARVVDLLRRELEGGMALMGCTSTGDPNPPMIYRP